VRLPGGYARRAAGAADLPAIDRLLADCDAAESEPGYRDLAAQIRAVIEDDAPRRSGEALVVADARRRLVACAAVRLPDYPRPIAFARLLGAVHPRHRRRGIGGHLLDLSARLAGARFELRHEGRPRSLRISFGGTRDDAERLYRRHGFRLHGRELQLRRDLSAPVAGRPLPPGLTTAAWAPGTRHLFYAAYAATHIETPEDRTRTEAEWCAGVAADGTLRPDLSLVALDGARPCAYILSEVVPRDGRDVGWIWLLAVDPAYRRRGLATSLVSRVLCAFRAEGLPEAGLWVDEANPAARTAYDRLGFRQRSRLTTYEKPAGSRSTSPVPAR
jgi:mycothiol synthase